METNPTSSILNALGAGSGVNMIELAENLADIRFASQRARLEASNEQLETQISAASTLRSQLTQLSSALGDRIRTGDLAPTATISNTAVASVSVAAASPGEGNYSLEVTQLAGAQTLASKAYASADALAGEGTLAIRFGTVSGGGFNEDAAQTALSIAVTSDDTLETLADKINQAGGSVSAYVATNAGGAQLVIKGQEGAANGFVVDGQSSALLPVNEAGNLRYLGWEPATDQGQLRQSATDAEFLFDGVEMTRPSNEVSGLPAGLSLTLTATNIGSPAQIGFGDASGEIAGVMSDFVAALNDITSTLQASAAPLGGELGSDPGARALKRALSALSTQVVMPNAGPGEPSTLGDLGLKIDRNGSFSLDSDRLNQTLSDNREAAAGMFTVGLFGVFATFDGLARSMTERSDPGSLAGSVERYTQKTARNDERLEKIAAQQEVLRERLVKQYTASDRNVISSQSTLDFLRAQISVWNQGSN